MGTTDKQKIKKLGHLLVDKGDNLLRIAERQLGDPAQSVAAMGTAVAGGILQALGGVVASVIEAGLLDDEQG